MKIRLISKAAALKYIPDKIYYTYKYIQLSIKDQQISLQYIKEENKKRIYIENYFTKYITNVYQDMIYNKLHNRYNYIDKQYITNAISDNNSYCYIVNQDLLVIIGKDNILDIIYIN